GQCVTGQSPVTRETTALMGAETGLHPCNRAQRMDIAPKNRVPPDRSNEQERVKRATLLLRLDFEKI
ncbi:MAG: hypothetical protein K2R98_16315, partial [Gemmataceae bacterium]|nr:hypothetical protein [Gemmataceae bacterium]